MAVELAVATDAGVAPIRLKLHQGGGRPESPINPSRFIIKVPTLVLVGSYDIFCPPTSAQITHDGIVGSKRVVFENSGHFPWIEEPGSFFSVVTDFINGKS